MPYMQPARAVYTLGKLFHTDEVIAAAYRRQALHARVLGVLCKKIGYGDRVSDRIIAKHLRVDPYSVLALRRHYPATFRLMDEYEMTRRQWVRRKREIEQQELIAHQTRLVPDDDPLLYRLKQTHVTA